ncbi:MAG: MoaD/ThiS family protein [Candidatus Micrarchaeota archaeon]|nr:MoaD/ThiS family protein [Candidatus Micrarchaeota archaeon]
MNITFYLDGKKKQVETKTDTTLRDVLKQEKINEETGLIKLNGTLCHPLQTLKDGDTLEFVNIIYGG